MPTARSIASDAPRGLASDSNDERHEFNAALEVGRYGLWPWSAHVASWTGGRGTIRMEEPADVVGGEGLVDSPAT